MVALQALEDDWLYCQKHAPEKRLQFSAFQQMGNITYDRNSLVHDDRADCVQRLVEVLAPHLSRDEEQLQVQRDEAVVKEWLKNPMGYNKEVLKQFGSTQKPRRRQQRRRR